MGAKERSKGRRGETEAKLLLESRDWSVADLSAGLMTEDLLVTTPDGTSYCCEVKNTKTCQWAYYVAQAKRQAKARKLPWMLMIRIAGYPGTFVVLREGEQPVVWK